MLQSLSVEQPHTPADCTQTGVADTAAQSAVLVVEHCVHCPASEPPAGWQAGAWAVGQLPGGAFEA